MNADYIYILMLEFINNFIILTLSLKWTLDPITLSIVGQDWPIQLCTHFMTQLVIPSLWKHLPS